MARKKSQVSAEDLIRQMYPDLKTSDDFEEEKRAKEAPQSAEQQLATLQAKIALLENRPAGPVAATPLVNYPTPPMQPKFDEANLPDPAIDPTGYSRAVREMVTAQANYEKEAYRWQQQAASIQSSRTQGLWDSFASTYEGYAKNEDRVEIAAARVVSKARAAGLDTEKYMYEQSDKFMRDVVSEMDKLGWKPAADEDDDDAADDDDDRASIIGGTAAATRPSDSRHEPPPRFGAMSQDIIAWQEKTGFHR